MKKGTSVKSWLIFSVGGLILSFFTFIGSGFDGAVLGQALVFLIILILSLRKYKKNDENKEE